MNIEYKAFDGSIRTLGDNELQHWKYIKKIPAGSGFRYFYSWDEYRAYLADPTAELKKAGSQVSKQIQSTTRRGSQEVRSTGRSVQKYVSKGRKKVESTVSSRDRSKLTVSGARQANESRDPSVRQRLNEFAKKVSQKWEEDKQSIKDKIVKAKEWFKNLFSDDDPEKPQDQKKKNTDPYEKYKYVKKITINGKTRYFYSQDEIDAYNRRDAYQVNEPDYLKKLKHSDDPYTHQEDALLVNPKYDSRDSDDRYEYNCAECTAIYELRRRGYDVESNGISTINNDPTVFGRLKELYNATKYNTDLRFKIYYENAKIQTVPRTTTDEETYRAIYNEINKNPPGSRGDLSVAWKDSDSGHSMVWEKDSKGNIRIIDTQTSGNGSYTEYDLRGLSEDIDNSSRISTHRARVTRTDNLKLKKGITNICQNSNSKPNYTSGKNSLPWNYRMTEDGHIRFQTLEEKEYVTQYPVLMEDYNRKHAE